LYHFDWYRIEDPEELFQSGLNEFIGTDGITLIEWHERAEELLPENCMEVQIKLNEDLSREVSFIPRGNFRAIEIKEVP
jgi:tRNA threonylcarbamoyladenosine biosynthesis protein TsaE